MGMVGLRTSLVGGLGGGSLRLVVSLFCFWLAAVPQLARAQDGGGAAPVNTAETARSMYTQAVEHADAERWQEAADLFERLLDIRWSLRIAYNYASALVQLGRLLEASKLLNNVIREAEADATGSPASEQLQIVAEMLLDQVEPELGQLTVNVDGDPDRIVIEIDGQRHTRSIGEPIAVDPGLHLVNLRRGGSGTEPMEVTLGGDEPLEQTITIDASDLGPMPSATMLHAGGGAGAVRS